MARTAYLHLNGTDYQLPGYYASSDGGQLAQLLPHLVRQGGEPRQIQRVILNGVEADLHITIADIQMMAVYVVEEPDLQAALNIDATTDL